MTALTLNLLYENEDFRIGFNKDFSILELTFLQHPDPEHFRNAYSLAFGAASNKDVKNWLTDATRIIAMARENQIWLMERMMPLLKSYQISRFAIVMAPECFVMTNPNQVYEKQNSSPENQTPGQIKVHFDKEAAYNWMFNGKAIMVS